MTKLRAFAIHFGISFLVFIGLVYMVIKVWYPSFSLIPTVAGKAYE